MKIDTDAKKIDEILTRSIKEVLPTKDSLKELLSSGKRIRIYIGTDATGTSLHLGHSTNYIILEKFRRLGHEVIFLVGDFTARIGDPTDRVDSARKQLTREQVVENVKTWLDQVKPVIDVDNKENPVKILYNDEWLSKLTFEDVINISSNFTVQQMIERDMFQERLKAEKPLYLHEMFYPLMQGYDSVVMDVDVEMCGNDQKFNALAGRTLLKKLKNKEKYVLITTLLENPVTGEKMMSKSLGTGVFLDFEPAQMYGAIMAQPDENMRQLFVDCTHLEISEIEEIIKNHSPMDAKKNLALEITAIYHGEAKAREAEDDFVTKFQKREIPEEIDEFKVSVGNAILDAVTTNSIVESKSEFRRLIEEGAITNLETKEKITDPSMPITQDISVKIGKKRFVKFIVE